jgi:hypothetical protein
MNVRPWLPGCLRAFGIGVGILVAQALALTWLSHQQGSLKVAGIAVVTASLLACIAHVCLLERRYWRYMPDDDALDLVDQVDQEPGPQ